MQVVILAGGYGTRIAEETSSRPKPMIEIGGMPILWHIMKYYSHFGFTDFILCLGYKGYQIKEFFANYFLHKSDVTIDLANNRVEVHDSTSEPWRVTLVDTGQHTLTGGRLKRVRGFVKPGQHFLMTYGDGLSNVDLHALIAVAQANNLLATVTAVQPPGRFGSLQFGDDRVSSFEEKPAGDGGWINGGFFVLKPEALDRVAGDQISWEKEPLASLAAEGQLGFHQHLGFWQPLDTLREKLLLEDLWQSGSAPWKVW